MEEQRIEIIEKEVINPKLTISKYRITIKFPIGYSKKKEVTELFLRVAKKIGKPIHTLRGTLGNQPFLQLSDTKGQVLFREELDNL